MLIRSQDKKKIINMNNITSIGIGNNYRIFSYFVGGDYDTIGEYSTEAKAIKVLDMIQKAYTPSVGEIQAYIDGVIPKNVVENRVFQMPQESEEQL